MIDSAAEKELYGFDEEFRNSISTVDSSGKRIWVYPKKPAGRFHNRRIIVTIILLTIFFTGPFISINGNPLLLLNFIGRKFIILGYAFWPQDFFLLALVLVLFFVFVILFTVVFGRVWCGWACPQTLFMEMVFRKIEYWIEGDAMAQRRLKEGPWTKEKILKKTAKQFLFILFSSIIAFTTLAYFIGKDQLIIFFQDVSFENSGQFVALVSFTLIFYSVFAFFREQACTVVCPYGRLQGVLLGKDSIVVAYDWIRGEPKTKIRKNQPLQSSAGDCIDCKLCVHVCPTGIDIRNGTQLECVNCTACIDACDDVMEKIGKPKGLIRFASYDAIQNGIHKIFTPRVAGYSLVLIALVALFSFMVARRSIVETTILKIPGSLYQIDEEGYATNIYSVEFVNKTLENITLELKIEEPSYAQLIIAGNTELILPSQEIIKIVCVIKIPADKITETKSEVTLGVFSQGERIETITSTFIGPLNKLK